METNSTDNAAISGHVDLEVHPFQYLPASPGTSITYIGSSMCDVQVKGFVRIIGWELVNGDCPHKVTFLRKIQSSSFEEQQYHFYEIGIGLRDDGLDTNIFMIGEDMYSHSPNQSCRRRLDLLWDFFSQMYNLPNIEEKLMYTDAQLAYEWVQREKERQAPDQAAYERTRLILEKTHHHFHKGQKVVWGTPAFHSALPMKPKKNDVYEVLGVEIIPNYCSCGLGDKADIRFHAERRCNLKRRHMAMHHQILTLKVGGHREHMSGHYFLPLEAL
jgi:hypothetical protein